jgi:hypothetical protein
MHFKANHDMLITGVVVSVGLSIILFGVFREKTVWSIPVRQEDEHMIALPASGGLSLLLGQKQEAYKTPTKEQQRFWKRILIIDDNADLTLTFKEVIEDSNNDVDVNKRIEVYTSNDPTVALSDIKPNFYDLPKISGRAGVHAVLKLKPLDNFILFLRAVCQSRVSN